MSTRLDDAQGGSMREFSAEWRMNERWSPDDFPCLQSHEANSFLFVY